MTARNPLDLLVPGMVLCQTDELDATGGRSLVFGEGAHRIQAFVVKFEGEIIAYLNDCPHAHHPLEFLQDKFFDRTGDLLLCSSHGALFEPRSGKCVEGPCLGKALTPLKIREKDDTLYLEDPHDH